MGTSTPLEAKESFTKYESNITNYFWDNKKYDKEQLEQPEDSETYQPKTKYICDDAIDGATFNK